MRHLNDYIQYNEASIRRSIGKFINRVGAKIFLPEQDYNSYKGKKGQVSDELDEFDLVAKKTSDWSYNIFHNKRLIGIIRRSNRPSFMYLRLYVYQDELIAPVSEYEFFNETDREAVEIINKQPSSPVGMTRKKESTTALELLKITVKWWRQWSVSGRKKDRKR